MPRSIKLTSAAIVIAITGTIVGVVAYDRGRAAPQERTLSYDLSLESRAPVITGHARSDVTIQAQPARYRLNLAPRTVLKLGQHRNGCALTQNLPPEAVCDIATAFPDVGLDGTVTFVGSGHNTDATQTLIFNLRG